jgi:FeS assembly SUF system protein
MSDQQTTANEAATPNAGAPDVKELEAQVIKALKTCYDPEIPVNIYEMGLIYEIRIDPQGSVAIKMTLTSPNCPVAGSLPRDVETKVKAVPGVTAVKVELVWDPTWDPSKMSAGAKLALGMDLDTPTAPPGGMIPLDSFDRSRGR